MQLSARCSRLLAALGIDAGTLPSELFVPAPFAQTVLDLDPLVRWLGERCAERPECALQSTPPFNLLRLRVRDEVLRALAREGAAAAARHVAGLPDHGPLEATLHLGALAGMSARVAAGAPQADAAVRACAPLLLAPRPVARTAALRLGELGITEGPLGRRARAVLEGALSTALEAAHDLGASGQLAAQVGRDVAELMLPGMSDRVAAATGRIVDLVAVLGGLAAHRRGLTQRLSALAPQAPLFAAPLYVVAYLTALGAADRGPYLGEVHERLLRAAADTDPRVRALAVGALRDPDALIGALTDADETVRTAAALALAEVGAVPDAAARELEDMIELGGIAAALAATRALARGGRAVPERLVLEIDEPLVQASARALAAPRGEDATFTALVEAYAQCEPEELSDLDERLQPMAILVEALHAMPVARAAGWLRRFAGGEALPTVGEVFYQALEDCELVPRALAEAGAPLVEVLAHGPEDRAGLVALVAARVLPAEPRLEALIVERTGTPVSLIALAALDHLSEETSEHLLALAEEPGDDHAALAVVALGRCDLGAEQARTVTTALAAHVRDDDPLCEPAYAALLELVDRGVLIE